MNERKEMADRHGMTIEYVNWFYDNKKESCGNLWPTMLGAMWAGWQASREAIEIELPEVCAWNLCELLDKKEVIEAIRAAGIKVKE